jgi:hypothetical protein
MKRIAFCLLAAGLPLVFNACEGHKAEDLPPHYQHRMHHDEHHPKAGEKSAEHPKTDAAKPTEGEKKHN